MSAPTPSYPASVWNGGSASRTADPNLDREPSFKDWDRAVEEVQAMQTHVVGGIDTTAVNSGANGCVPISFTFNIPNTAADYDIVVTNKIAITGVTVIKKGSTGSTNDAITVKNGTTAVSNVMSLNAVAVKTVVRNTEIDTANWLVAAGGTLRVTAGKTTDCSCEVIVDALVSA